MIVADFMPNPELLLGERQALIRKRLASDGRVIAAALAREWNISEDTIQIGRASCRERVS
jgi:hypothetical protein